MIKPKITHDSWRAEIGPIVLGSQIGPQKLHKLVHVHQVHSANVIRVESESHSTIQADGLFSSQAGLTLAVKTADCVPIHLWDGEQIAMVHAGWRGTKAGIVGNSLRVFSDLKSVRAVIGPAICADHYEVGPDLYDPWSNEDSNLNKYLKPGKGDRKLLDLKGFITNQLKLWGLLPDHIFVLNLCTFNSALPSYRREGQKAARLFNYIRRKNG